MNVNKLRSIDSYSSVALDSLRIIAALMVLVFHIFNHWMPLNNSTILMSHTAHGGVVLFFVLSGFVIAYSADQNNRGGMKYFQARFSRLYSVLIPALVITGLIQLIVYNLNIDLYSSFTRGPSLPRYILSGLFMNEIWLLSAAPPINGPLWSLSYEFWYYIIFGLFMFRRKGWKWFVPSIIACLLAGPKIFIMMPIWLLGCLAYRSPRPNLSKNILWVLFAVFISLSVVVMCYITPFPFDIREGHPLSFSSQFITDWLAGICVAGAVWVIPPFEGKATSTSMILYLRKTADITFPLYILHYPLLILYDAFGFRPINSILDLWVPFTCILTAAVLIGIVLERFRPYWTKFFSYVFTRIAAIRTKFNHKPIKDPIIVPSIK
jgi:peptidoglycan/LPS O-acetylase OafA/YrhL